MAPQLPTELEPLRDRVCKDWDLSEKMHASWRRETQRYYESYRVFKDWRKAYNEASPRDKDAVRRDGEMTWSAELHIPYAFSTVETVLAQMLAHRPRMLVQPRDEEALGNVHNMEFLIDAQQERIDYELVLQDIGKDGLIGGLGWQKMYWESKTRERKVVRPRLIPGTGYTEKRVRDVVVDDWKAERVEPFDMRWDPYAGDVKDCGYLIHRTWRDAKYIAKMVREGIWLLPEGWDLEDLLSVGTENRHYSETFSQRNQASGLSDWAKDGKVPYEVWEHHDGEQVLTLLGRQVPVQLGENPCWGGDYAFQAYRPTTAGNGLLPGIGEIEPLEHLIREIDTLRTQRRWNAALVLQTILAYRAGVVDPDDLKFAPGMLWPVNGDPNELLKQIEVRDIPFSSFREEERLEGNIDRTSGVGDPLTGAAAQSGTATEAQLVRAAASTRIQNKARRLEVEIIKTGGDYAVELNQQKILTERYIQVPLPPQPYEAERRWAWRKIGPAELMGKMSVKVDGGSTMAENVPQNRADALQIANLMRGDPHIQQRRMWEEVIKKFGYENPQFWLVPEGPQIPPETLQFLEDKGVRPELIQQALEEANRVDPTGGQGPAQSADNAPDPALEMARQS